MKTKTLLHNLQPALNKVRLLTVAIVMGLLTGNVVIAQTNAEFEFPDDPEYSILKSAIDKSDFDINESKWGYYTFFAPTNNAFRALGDDKLKYLFNNPKELYEILKYHFVSGKIYAKDLSDGQILEMRDGTDAFISLFNDKAYINQAKIIRTDIRTFTGVIHYIDAVLM